MNFEFEIKTKDDLDKKIIIYVFQEKTNPEIAEKTGYSMGYIKRRLHCLFKTYGVKSKVGLVREILRLEESAGLN